MPNTVVVHLGKEAAYKLELLLPSRNAVYPKPKKSSGFAVGYDDT